jgi:putative peptide zinc metalloprotease protein
MSFLIDRIRRLALPAVLVAMAALLVVASATPAAAGGDTTAVAVNTKDNKSVFDIKFAFKRINSDVVDPVNAAVAFASCTDCQTVAISIQVVFVMSDPTSYTATNEAIAINYMCNYCNTLADAYQFGMTTSGPVHLTPEGSREVASIRQQLEQIRTSGETNDQIVAQVDVLMQQLSTVLQTQVVPAGNSGGGTTDNGAGQPAASSPAPAASPTGIGGASPAPSASPSATASPAPTPSASP